jgi:hypothetical protein
MSTDASDNSDPRELGYSPDPRLGVDTLREGIPPYRPVVTPTRRSSAVADCLGTDQDVHGSGHLGVSFAAWDADTSFVTGIVHSTIRSVSSRRWLASTTSTAIRSIPGRPTRLAPRCETASRWFNTVSPQL